MANIWYCWHCGIALDNVCRVEIHLAFNHTIQEISSTASIPPRAEGTQWEVIKSFFMAKQ